VVHGTSAGVFKQRVGDQCLPLGGTTLRDLQAVRGQYDGSAEMTSAGMAAISPGSVARAAEQGASGNRSRIPVHGDRSRRPRGPGLRTLPAWRVVPRPTPIRGPGRALDALCASSPSHCYGRCRCTVGPARRTGRGAATSADARGPTR
jgi:hypothetical protein